MTTRNNRLTVDLTQTNHLIFHDNAVAGQFLDVVSLIALTRTGTQVDHKGKDRQTIAFYGATDIAGPCDATSECPCCPRFEIRNESTHPRPQYARESGYRRAGFHSGLLGLEHLEHLDVSASECEADEIVRVGLNQVFGYRIVFGHKRHLEKIDEQKW